jgi:aminopeptidase N
VAANTAPAYSNDSTARAQRSLKNTALAYLAKLKAPELVADAVARYHAADNMTDQVCAHTFTPSPITRR